ncbi:MAG TPA: hypothetical protein VF773_19490 [Verrucomicrobiae bacterium]
MLRELAMVAAFTGVDRRVHYQPPNITYGTILPNNQEMPAIRDDDRGGNFRHDPLTDHHSRNWRAAGFGSGYQ